MTGVACSTLDGRPVAVTTSWDQTVRVWDLTTRTAHGAPMNIPEPGQNIQITTPGDIIVAFGWDIAVLRAPQ